MAAERHRGRRSRRGTRVTCKDLTAPACSLGLHAPATPHHFCLCCITSRACPHKLRRLSPGTSQNSRAAAAAPQPHRPAPATPPEIARFRNWWSGLGKVAVSHSKKRAAKSVTPCSLEPWPHATLPPITTARQGRAGQAAFKRHSWQVQDAAAPLRPAAGLPTVTAWPVSSLWRKRRMRAMSPCDTTPF